MNHLILTHASGQHVVCDSFFSNLDQVSCRASRVTGCTSSDYESVRYGKGKQIKCISKKLCVATNSQKIVEACLEERSSILPSYSVTYCDPSYIRRTNGRIENFGLKGCDKTLIKDKTNCFNYKCGSRDDFQKLTRDSCVTYLNRDELDSAMAQISSGGVQFSQYECLNENCVDNEWEVFLPEDKCSEFIQKCEMSRTHAPELSSDVSRISSALNRKYLIPTSDLLSKLGQESFYLFTKNNDTGLFDTPMSVLVAGNNISVNGMPQELGVKPGESYVQFVAPLSASESIPETLIFLEKSYPNFQFKSSGSFNSLGIKRFAFTYLPKNK